MTNADLFTGLAVLIFIAMCGAVRAVTRTITEISDQWRPIIQAYLEAKAAAAGAPMHVPDPKATPGKLYAPRPPQWEGEDESA